MKSQVRLNADRDDTYCPYCMRCSGLVRMKIVERYYWKCDCGAEHDERDYSVFAMCLRNLLFDTNLFTEQEWCKYLAVDAKRLAGWLFDKGIPRPDNLNMIVIAIEECTDTLKGPLLDFQEISKRRATTVSPHGARMLPTVESYRLRPAISEMASRLAKLNPDEQTKLLLEMYPEETE